MHKLDQRHSSSSSSTTSSSSSSSFFLSNSYLPNPDKTSRSSIRKTLDNQTSLTTELQHYLTCYTTYIPLEPTIKFFLKLVSEQIFLSENRRKHVIEDLDNPNSTKIPGAINGLKNNVGNCLQVNVEFLLKRYNELVMMARSLDCSYIGYDLVENCLVGLVQLMLKIYKKSDTFERDLIEKSCIINASFHTKLSYYNYMEYLPENLSQIIRLARYSNFNKKDKSRTNFPVKNNKFSPNSFESRLLDPVSQCLDRPCQKGCNSYPTCSSQWRNDRAREASQKMEAITRANREKASSVESLADWPVEFFRYEPFPESSFQCLMEKRVEFYKKEAEKEARRESKREKNQVTDEEWSDFERFRAQEAKKESKKDQPKSEAKPDSKKISSKKVKTEASKPDSTNDKLRSSSKSSKTKISSNAVFTPIKPVISQSPIKIEAVRPSPQIKAIKRITPTKRSLNTSPTLTGKMIKLEVRSPSSSPEKCVTPAKYSPAPKSVSPVQKGFLLEKTHSITSTGSSCSNSSSPINSTTDELTKILSQNTNPNLSNFSKIQMEYQELHAHFLNSVMQNSPESVSLSEISGAVDNCLPNILCEEDVVSEEEEDEIEITFDSEGNMIFESGVNLMGDVDKRPQRNYNGIGSLQMIDKNSPEYNMIQIGDDYVKEATYVFPEELKNNVLGLWRHHNIMSKQGKYWTLKDTISLLTLSRIFGAGNYALIKDLKLPRFDRFNRREIKARFNNLEKRRIVLRLKDDKTKFFVNHGDLKHIIDENEKRQIWFIQNNRALFNEKLLGQTKFDQSLQRLLC